MALVPKALVFDFYGTLANVTAVAEACRRVTADADAFCALWRQKQLEYTWLASLMGRYQDFMRITERAMEFALARFQLTPSRAARTRLLGAWLKPVPYPEVSPALEEMGPRFKLAVLSNGTPAMLKAGLKATRLMPFFRTVLSAHTARVFKPSPKVYELAPQKLGCAPRDILFVSSNSWDATGAKNFGMRVCWVNRADMPFDTLGAKPDLVVADLAELAAALGKPSTRASVKRAVATRRTRAAL